jgi:adenylate kinase family enzyme
VAKNIFNFSRVLFINNEKKTMTVELVGLSASGKSTVARILAKDNRFLRVRFASKTKMLYYFLLFVCAQPLKFFWLNYYWFINGHNFTIKKLLYLNAVVQAGAKFAWAKYSLSATIKIIDQGLIQNYLILMDRATDEIELKLFFKRCVGKIDKVIFFTVDENQRQQWLAKRGFNGQERHLAEEDRKVFTSRLLKNASRLTAYLHAEYKNNLLEIIQPQSQENIVQLIKNKLL